MQRVLCPAECGLCIPDIIILRIRDATCIMSSRVWSMYTRYYNTENKDATCIMSSRVWSIYPTLQY